MKVQVHTVTNYRNFKYAVEIINTGIDMSELCNEIRKWLWNNNITNQEASIDYIWYLERREDLTLFMLRWS